MEYYIYISDQKVDMLACQIPEKRIKAVARHLEIAITLPWVPITAKYKPGAPMPSDQDRIRRLRVVEQELISDRRVGHLSDSRPWIRSSMDMRWGFIDGERQAVWFLGKAGPTTIVMGGSSRHLVGGVVVAQQPHHAYSLLPVLAEALIERAESLGELDASSDHRTVFDAADVLARSVAGPQQCLRFVAKALAAREVDGERLILATPLCVTSDAP